MPKKDIMGEQKDPHTFALCAKSVTARGIVFTNFFEVFLVTLLKMANIVATLDNFGKLLPNSKVEFAEFVKITKCYQCFSNSEKYL